MDCENTNQLWDWQGEDYCVQKDTHLDIPQCLWKEDMSYMFDETTPVKACGDLAYDVADSVIMEKELQPGMEMSSQKRRRMLQFDHEVLVNPLCNEDSSGILKSKESEDSLEDALSDMSQWVSGFASYEVLDQSSEEWLADCFNDTELQCSLDDKNLSGDSDVQIGTSEFCNNPPVCEATVAQKRPTRTRRNVTVKGKKSCMQTPTKLASSVAYPFAFIKPCGAHGDVTLKDINQWIHSPAPTKLKHSGKDPSPSYPTSAFSGKPVVGKAKIHTEGGKGSITIMRTKG